MVEMKFFIVLSVMPFMFQVKSKFSSSILQLYWRVKYLSQEKKNKNIVGESFFLVFLSIIRAHSGKLYNCLNSPSQEFTSRGPMVPLNRTEVGSTDFFQENVGTRFDTSVLTFLFF